MPYFHFAPNLFQSGIWSPAGPVVNDMSSVLRGGTLARLCSAVGPSAYGELADHLRTQETQIHWNWRVTMSEQKLGSAYYTE